MILLRSFQVSWNDVGFRLGLVDDPPAHDDTDIQKHQCSLVKRQIN